MFYKKIDKNFATKVLKTVETAEKIVITSHVTPDDDSIASVLALYYYLVNHRNISQEKLSMIITGKKPGRWEYFSNYDKVEYVTDLADELDGVGVLIMLDGSGWDRFNHKQELSSFGGRTICIDHHPNPSNEFDLHMLSKKHTSTVEIIYHLFYKDKDIKIDKSAAEIILMGILGDTGNFKFVKPEMVGVFDVVKELVREGGIIIEDLKSQYDVFRPEVFDIYARFMSNSKVEEIDGWPKMLISALTRKEINDGGWSEVDIDEARNIFKPMLKTIEGVPWGFVIYEKNEDCGASFRSIPGSVNVRDAVEKMGIGGGHDRAAAGKIPVKTAKEAKNFIFNWLERNKPAFS